MNLLPDLLVGAAGAAVGSYVGAAALRATRGEASTVGRSHCDGCGRTLRAWETIPLMSYAVVRGGCRTCGHRILLLHPAAELAGAAVAVGLWRLGAWPAGGLMAAMAAALLAASVIDLRTLKLPDALTAVVAVAAAGLAWLRGPPALAEGAVAAAIAFALLAGLRWASAAAGRDPGLGFGDVKLVAALALWLGRITPWMVVAAAAIGLAAILARRERGRIPFGPMLAAAGWACGFGLEAGWWPE